MRVEYTHTRTRTHIGVKVIVFALHIFMSLKFNGGEEKPTDNTTNDSSPFFPLVVQAIVAFFKIC